MGKTKYLAVISDYDWATEVQVPRSELKAAIEVGIAKMLEVNEDRDAESQEYYNKHLEPIITELRTVGNSTERIAYNMFWAREGDGCLEDEFDPGYEKEDICGCALMQCGLKILPLEKVEKYAAVADVPMFDEFIQAYDDYMGGKYPGYGIAVIIDG